MSELNTGRKASMTNVNRFSHFNQSQHEIENLLSSRILTFDTKEDKSEVGSPLMMSPRSDLNFLHNYLKKV
jgi:hypothetical protein